MQHGRASLSVNLDYQGDFFEQYKFLVKDENQHAFLESGRGGRYSIAGIKPIAAAKGKDYLLSITDAQGTNVLEGEPLELFQEWYQQFHTEQDPNLPDFQGGAIGFISYDYVRYFEKLPTEAADDLETPDLYVLLFDDVAVFDHQTSKLWLITHYYQEQDKQSAEQKLQKMKEMWTCERKTINQHQMMVHKQSRTPITFSKDSFMNAVEKIKALYCSR